jgi:hypothetical protein
MFGTNVLAGATNPVLTVTNIQLTDAGDYLAVLANAAGSSTSVVAVLTVNRLPNAANDAKTAYMSLAATMPVSQLITNDSDPDMDPLDITAVSATSTNGGTVALALGNVTYTPVSGYLGSDLFTYTLADGRGGFATGHVIVQVQLPAAPTLNSGSLMFANGHFRFGFSATPSVPYTIQTTTNLLGPWGVLTNQMTGLDGVLSVEDFTEPRLPLRFYRAVYP